MIAALYGVAAIAFGVAIMGVWQIVEIIRPLLDHDAAAARLSAFERSAVTELEEVP